MINGRSLGGLSHYLYQLFKVMIGAFWICVFMVVVGIVLYIGELRWRRKNKARGAGDGVAGSSGDAAGSAAAGSAGIDNNGAGSGADSGAVSGDAGSEADGEAGADAAGEECCGLHLVCEKDSLSPMSDDILYYDDEELDRFIGRAADSYSAEEEEEFRDVLMTLRPEDVAGWARSVTQRHLELPPDVRDELLLLVNEQRNSHQ